VEADHDIGEMNGHARHSRLSNATIWNIFTMALFAAPRLRGSALNPLRFIAVFLSLAVPAHAQDVPRLKVGVTLHAYYSWTANIVGDAPVDVVPVLGPEADPGTYQPTPEDIRRLADLDALVVNGLGHDAFIDRMLQASGNTKVRVIHPNAGAPLIPYHRGRSHAHGDETKEEDRPVAYNPHTFLSLTTAIQQVYALERELSALAPAHVEAFKANARAYAKRLRRLKAEASAKLAAPAVARVATVHDGYAYLLQEFGIEIVAVIEPAHGVQPSAGELAKTVEAIRSAGVTVVFSELAFPEKLTDVIRREAGARVYTLDHISRGPYTPGRFEEAMKGNVETLEKALVAEEGSRIR
jgi:zinc transport system substrate-binding protein